MIKQLSVWSLLIVISIGLCSCSRTKLKIDKEVRHFWGSKDQIVEFLGKPEARAERWEILAIGD